MPPSNPQSVAARLNQRLIASVEKRADAEGTVIGPCLNDYKRRLSEGGTEHPLFDLTRHLLLTFPETERSIRTRMEAKHAGKPDAAAQVEGSVRNSLMRSAGTNYQGLVSYAIARHLLEQGSAWYVEHPVPPEFGRLLAIRFTLGIAGEPTPVESGIPPAPDEEPEGATARGAEASVDVKPDVDVLIRNAGWESGRDGGDHEPIVLLSVKTSLADRAGSAARWKNYFDIVTSPCPHEDADGCVYRRLGMTLAHDPQVEITHGIVTANIYKVNSDPYYARYGELRSNQARANTFMFDMRYGTRNTTDDLTAPGWQPLSGLPERLGVMSDVYRMPR